MADPGEFSVEVYDADHWQDITEFVHELGRTSLYSDGRIATSTVTLQASFGQFVTDDTNGTTPIIRQFALMRLTFTDTEDRSYSRIFEVINDLGQVTREGEYLLPLTLEGRERALSFIPVSGYYDPPLGHATMAARILNAYNNTKGGGQPAMGTDVLQLLDVSPNFWDFMHVENCLDALQEIIRSAQLPVTQGGLGDRFGIVFGDSDLPALMNVMQMAVYVQGANGTPAYVRSDDIHYPVQSIEKIKEPITGTTVVARGRPGSGGFPHEFDTYRSLLEFYERSPPWNPRAAYKAGSYVMYGPPITDPPTPPAQQLPGTYPPPDPPKFGTSGQVWKAAADIAAPDMGAPDNTPPDMSADWSREAAKDYLGDIQYSPYTQDKAKLFCNECTNPTGFNSSGQVPVISDASPQMLDSNIVIEDVYTKRDFVDIRTWTSVPAQMTADQRRYLFGISGNFFNGFRILVDESLVPSGATPEQRGAFVGNDPNGRPYANNPAVYLDGEWYVIKVSQDFDQVVVRNEGLFEWNVPFTTPSDDAERRAAVVPSNPDGTDAQRRGRRYRGGTPTVAKGWRTLSGNFLANDCLHPPKSIENSQGLVSRVRKGATPAVEDYYSDDSAVKITYEFSTQTSVQTDGWVGALDQIIGLIAFPGNLFGNILANLATSALQLFFTPEYRTMGWWMTWTAPWPYNKSNGITEDIGALYGGSNLGKLRNHPYFDAYNQRVTPKGEDGWNAADAEDMMEVTGVTFLFRLEILDNGSPIFFEGDIPVSFWVCDTNGNLYKAKGTYRHLGDVQRMTFDWGNFTPIYRARSPFGISNIVTNVLVPELEIRERVFPARIKMMGFQLELAYDEHGRYMPDFVRQIIKPEIHDIFAAGHTIQYVGEVDAFQFVKTPIAIHAAPDTDNVNRTLFPEFRDSPNEQNTEQLRRTASAQADIEYFQYEQYTLVQNDAADLALQQTVWLREPGLVPDHDMELDEVPLWTAGTPYKRGAIARTSSAAYDCIADTTDEPLSDRSHWTPIVLEAGSTIPNTRELVVGEIHLSVTNGRDWRREMVLYRRFPRRTA